MYYGLLVSHMKPNNRVVKLLKEKLRAIKHQEKLWQSTFERLIFLL